jgi:hypothetical protein
MFQHALVLKSDASILKSDASILKSDASILKSDASIIFSFVQCEKPTTEKPLMTKTICRQAWNVWRFAGRLEESSLADAETTSRQEMLPDGCALRPATDERSFDRESPSHPLPKFPANVKTTTSIN